MPPVTAWCDAEDAALQGLSAEAQVLYLRGLRRWMDYASGVVGVRRKVSWQALTEVLYVEPGRGKQRAGSMHASKVRRLVGELERAGLAQKRSSRRVDDLIFFLPLALSDESARKKPDKFPTSNREETRQGPRQGETQAGRGLDGDTRQGTRQPLTNLSTGNPTNLRYPEKIITPDARARARMGMTWWPVWERVELHLVQMGINPKSVSEEERAAAVGEFRSYWSEQEAEFTEGQWEQRLASSIKRGRGRGRGDAKGGGRGKGSADAHAAACSAAFER